MKVVSLGTVVFVLAFAFALLAPGVASAQAEQACWGQATKVFAQAYGMGEHASQQETPRLGLRNLARSLYDAGLLPDDSMQSLARFVSAELGLEVCR
jgi:hypothetical protein